MTVGENAPHPNSVIWALLAHAIDYAGLFPPAQLDMAGAVAEYESYLGSSDEWALGRFVVPAARLEELAGVAEASRGPDGEALGESSGNHGLTVVVGSDLAGDIQRIAAYTTAHEIDEDRWWGGIECVELRAATLETIEKALAVVPPELERYVEIPIVGDTTPLVRSIGAAGAFAKVRTGGTAAEAIPSSADLARFLATCVREDVPFKATAGLHHPLRGDYPLTYAPDSAEGRMYGFLNVFLASALLNTGVSESVAREMLEEQSGAAIRFDESGVEWRGHRLTTPELLHVRGVAIRSFGSCSFREPIDDLTALGIL